MTHISPEVTELQGFWIDIGSSVTPDANWERIKSLTSEYLEILATSGDGQECLYRDPADGRLWELIPVDPNLPAGPPLLRVISPSQARDKYAVNLT
jgi:hypothetical protein